MKKKVTKIATFVLVVCLALCLLAGAALLGINAYVVNWSENWILSPEDAAKLTGADCILVLGCQVKASGVPSHMLEDRLRRSVELFQAGAAPKLLMSGDHGTADYNEVGAMKQYALDAGIGSSDVFMDHAGFSTYESMYRAKEIFGVKKLVIVTQQYHLYRAVYIAHALGMEAYGVACDYRSYSGQTARDIREILARNKDFLTGILKPRPTYLGPTVPISGDGDVTND